MKSLVGILALVLSSTALAAGSTTTGYESPLRFGLDFSYSPVKYKAYEYLPGQMADKNGWIIRAGFEWMPLTEPAGKFAIGVAGGYGKVTDADLGDPVKADLTTYPLETYFAYRADFMKNQILVPFGRIGYETTFVTQSSGTGASRSGVRIYKGLVVAGGLELCLNPFEPRTARMFDGNIGVNNSYLLVEYLKSSRQGATQPDLERSEWRFGLRLEF
jgi:hypothetical protein